MPTIIETEWGYTTFGATELMKPVRQIPKNYRNVTGIAAQTKASGQPMYESSLERDFITLLEFNPDVEAYTVQPLELEWNDKSGVIHTYTPDIYVQFKTRNKNPWVCEVKYRKDLKKDWEELRPKFREATRFCRGQDWRFRLMTEGRIRTPYLKNAKFLLRYRDQVPPVELMEIIDKRLEDMRETTPLGLIKAVFRDEWNQAKLLTVLWYMVSTFQVGVDLHRPLTNSSPIWWKP